MVGCRQDSFQSTNLTSIDIPHEVDESIQDYVPEQDITITYTAEVRGSVGIAEVEICYEVTVEEEKLFGLASKVEGEWYVTEPNNLLLKEKCSTNTITKVHSKPDSA